MEENNLSSGGWLEKGLALYNSGNYEEALNCYNNALELEPSFEEAWYRKGMVIGALGDFQGN